MAMTLEQLETQRDKLLQQAAAYAVMQSGDKRLEAFDAKDLERRIAILDTQITKLSGSSSGYVTRFYTR